MTALYYVFVYAVIMSGWWTLMRLMALLKPTDGETILFPKNLICAASGFGSGLLILWSLSRNGGLPYLASLPGEFWWWVALAIPLEVGIAFCIVKAMQESVASVAVHVTMLAPVIAIGTSFLLNVDALPSLMSASGILTIVLGLYVLHFSPQKYRRNLAGPLMDIWKKRGEWLWYAVAVAVLAGFAIPITKQTILLGDFALAVGLLQFLGWGVVYGLLAWRGGDFSLAMRFPRKRVLGDLVLMAILFGVANAFQAMAYQYHHAAAVSSLKRIEAPLTVFLCFLVPALRQDEQEDEGHFGCRIIGSLVAFGGAALIALGR